MLTFNEVRYFFTPSCENNVVWVADSLLLLIHNVVANPVHAILSGEIQIKSFS